MPVLKCSAQDEELATLYRSGMTLQAIGDQFGITRERVRQRLSRAGVTRREGGMHVRMSRLNEQRAAKRDLVYLKRYGCTAAHYMDIRNGPPSGSGVKPLSAYRSQKRNASVRGIEWDLTLAEWWAIWRASGKWGMRGRGQGYAMCRHSDSGPYAIGNVYIGGLGDNGREYQARRRGKVFSPKSEVFVTA
jgi:hypothetical protein